MKKIISYNPDLVPLVKKLRYNVTFGEIALWREIKNNLNWVLDEIKKKISEIKPTP